MIKEFDYVIAGGGSAGCALGARLAEDPRVSVAIVEAGGHGRDLLYECPPEMDLFLAIQNLIGVMSLHRNRV